MTDKKVIVAGWCSVDPKRRDEVVASFDDLVLRARSAPGCLDFAIAADAVDPSRINTFEFWRSEKDLRAWRRVVRPPKAITRPRRVEVQKHVVQRSGAPFS
jgi:quinol monooxygenase YgiN